MCVCVCVCVCACACVCVCVYVCACMTERERVCVYMRVSMCVCHVTSMRVCVYVCMCARGVTPQRPHRVFKHVFPATISRTCSLCTERVLSVANLEAMWRNKIQDRVHPQIPPPLPHVRPVPSYTCMHPYIHTYKLASINTYIYTCMHACIHTYI